MKLHLKIKELRREKNLSQEDLANLSGVRQGLISHYERGSRQPGIENMQKIARALGVSLDVFADYEVWASGPSAPMETIYNKEDHEIMTAWKALSPEQKNLTKKLIEQMIDNSQNESMVKKKRIA